MAEITPEVEVNEEELNNTPDYIAMIQQLKANSVPKDKHQKVLDENKRLVETLINGGQLAPQTESAKVDVAALRKELFTIDCNLNPLEFWDKALTLRDTLIEKEGYDMFVPSGTKVVATEEDIEVADRVSKVVKECIDYAEGDADVFRNELMRRTIDTPIPRRRK